MQAFELPPVPLREDSHGVVRVVGSRVTLDSIVAVFDRGATPEEIVQSFPSLGLGDVYAILAWVVSRRADVDGYLARRNGEEQEARQEAEWRFPSADLRERLLARRGRRISVIKIALDENFDRTRGAMPGVIEIPSIATVGEVLDDLVLLVTLRDPRRLPRSSSLPTLGHAR
jgi:uncharacterized protein (DUF433 family)